jgi:cell division septal protein FtsQ
MSERKEKISVMLIFILLFGGLCYLIFYSNRVQGNERIKKINIIGNNLLSIDEYLSFTKCNNVRTFSELKLGIIKDRFEKHPYIQRADVEYIGKNEVNIHLTEKKVYAVLLNGSEPYLVSEQFQILPLMANTKFVDFPVITNIKDSGLKTLSVMQSEDLIQAFKIIDAAGLTDTKILKKLSEINLRSGGDIVLSFSGFRSPVIFGRGKEAEKMISLEMLITNLFEGRNLLAESDYVDLRFADNIYLGNTVQRTQPEKNQD